MKLTTRQLQDKFKLTYKQTLFCLKYNGNATESARLAGYKECAVTGCNLLKNSKIKACLDYLSRRSQADIAILTRDDMLKLWSSIAKDTDETTANRLRSLELLAKAQGIFVDKQMILGNIKVDHLDRLSDSELISELQTLIPIALGKQGTIPWDGGGSDDDPDLLGSQE